MPVAPECSFLDLNLDSWRVGRRWIERFSY
jgi:hypothetical protein